MKPTIFYSLTFMFSISFCVPIGCTNHENNEPLKPRIQIHNRELDTIQKDTLFQNFYFGMSKTEVQRQPINEYLNTYEILLPNNRIKFITKFEYNSKNELSKIRLIKYDGHIYQYWKADGTAVQITGDHIWQPLVDLYESKYGPFITDIDTIKFDTKQYPHRVKRLFPGYNLKFAKLIDLSKKKSMGSWYSTCISPWDTCLLWDQSDLSVVPHLRCLEASIFSEKPIKGVYSTLENWNTMHVHKIHALSGSEILVKAEPEFIDINILIERTICKKVVGHKLITIEANRVVNFDEIEPYRSKLYRIIYPEDVLIQVTYQKYVEPPKFKHHETDTSEYKIIRQRNKQDI